METLMAPRGFRAAAGNCGIKHEAMDLALLVSDEAAHAAVVATTNRFKAAPVQVNQDHLAVSPKAQAILINSGIANAATGREGYEAARQTAQVCAKQLGIEQEDVLLASTGVIGLPLATEKIKLGCKNLSDELAVDRFEQVAEAIMTTDTVLKTAQCELCIAGETVRLLGIAKGSGMICPNMSTMLGFILTDASIAHSALERSLRDAVDKSFNAISVDGDSSTNDTVILMANGAAGNDLLKLDSDDYLIFAQALGDICEFLAKQIAADGEGASRLIEVQVEGRLSEEEALKCAKAVVNSSLVKTAVFGSDPNWGRIACALGYAGVDFEPEEVAVWIGDVLVCDSGGEVAFDENDAHQAMDASEVLIRCQIGEGQQQAKAWGCDLTYDYVRINAEYRS